MPIPSLYSQEQLNGVEISMLSRRELRSACDRVHFSEAKLQLFLGF